MKSLKPRQITKDWHLIDAANKSLGRVSTEVAMILMGKNKAIYSPNLDTGDYVVLINSSKVLLTGKKENQKKYFRHSGYPGGLYSKTAAQLREADSNDLIINAVYGMLPKTKMGKLMLKKLYVFQDSEHPYKNKLRS